MAYAIRNDGEMVKLVEEGEGWNIGEAKLMLEVARAVEGAEGACIRRSSIEWGELNVFVDGAGRARWTILRRYGDNEFVPRKDRRWQPNQKMTTSCLTCRLRWKFRWAQ